MHLLASEHSFYRVGREEGCLGEGTSVCKGWRRQCGAVWDGGWFCVAGVGGGGWEGCRLWGPQTQGLEVGTKVFQQGRGQPELSVGQRTGVPRQQSTGNGHACLQRTQTQDPDLQTFPTTPLYSEPQVPFNVPCKWILEFWIESQRDTALIKEGRGN